MRKVLLLVTLFVLLTSASVMAQADITIEFYFPTAVDAPINEIIQGYADQFHELHPNITVVPTYTGSYTQTRDTIRTELNGGGAGPDVAVMLTTDLYSFIDEGTIVPAQDYIDALEDPEAFVSDIFPAFLANSQDEEGTIWSLPFQRSTVILYYNADLLEAEGIAVPTNNEELLAAAQALTLPNGERWGLLVPFAGGFPIWVFQPFAIGNGRNITGETPTTVYMNDPQVIDALDFATKLGTEYAVGPAGGSVWGDTPTAFLNGQAAMIIHTTGTMTNLLNNATFEVGAAFVPMGLPNDEGKWLWHADRRRQHLYLRPARRGTQPEELEAAWLWARIPGLARNPVGLGCSDRLHRRSCECLGTRPARQAPGSRTSAVPAKRDQLAYAAPGIHVLPRDRHAEHHQRHAERRDFQRCGNDAASGAGYGAGTDRRAAGGI